MNISTKPIAGMRDFLPKDFILRSYVEKVILENYTRFGFHQIETPIMEDIAILNNGQGGENQKMIFKVLKRGEKLNLSAPIQNENDIVDYGLRFDLTLPLARFYADNRAQLPAPFKVVQMGYVWRAERPQKGRYRQLWQCDIDVIGSKSSLVEIELIYVTAIALTNLGFNNFKVRINDRRILEKLVLFCGFQKQDVGQVLISLDKLDKIGIEGVEKDLAQNSFLSTSVKRLCDIVQSFLEKKISLINIIEVIPDIDKEVVDNLKQVIDIISSLTNGLYKIEFDLSLVRGMGYYTGQIFEIAMEEFNSAIAGGGRYDNMIGRFLNGQEVPSCGFSIGFERIVHLLQEKGFEPPRVEKKLALIFELGTEDNMANLLIASNKLRETGWLVSIEIKQKNLKVQLDKLKGIGYTHFSFYNSGFPIEKPKSLL